jgi:hypothetical protein
MSTTAKRGRGKGKEKASAPAKPVKATYGEEEDEYSDASVASVSSQPVRAAKRSLGVKHKRGTVRTATQPRVSTIVEVHREDEDSDANTQPVVEEEEEETAAPPPPAKKLKLVKPPKKKALEVPASQATDDEEEDDDDETKERRECKLTAEQEEATLEWIQANPSLYDKQNKEYHLKDKKEALWEEIAAELNVSIIYCYYYILNSSKICSIIILLC